MQVTGVIFDCDGTLLDSGEAWLSCQNSITSLGGIELTEEEVDTVCALTIPETGEFFHHQFGIASSPEEVVDIIYESMGHHYQEQAVAKPGALDFVKALAVKGIVCSVASSTPRPLLEIGLAQTGFAPYLKAIVSVDDAGASKREPAVYDLARSFMGTEKETTWVFEDSVYALRTLIKAGYHTVGIYDDDVAGTLEELSIADITIQAFSELDPATFISGIR